MSARDLQIVQECLDAAIHGPFFEDWEFDTLMGLTRDEVAAIAASWPHADDADARHLAVNNVLNNLLGYPHGYGRRWHEFFSATPEEMADVLARWRGDEAFDASPKGTFDRLL
ncbi:hypothetical protein [Nonomuraea roseoviolacea]|uniref:Uncharacterized protein n=1 Tax=Nonomuraea roseoviolacea subsp. carminata TaxID=160689 RepID=A0ABT1JUS4_9ACTN|nr:hypothetical protein [Nonomuraea roseoviolacea]MCP2345097.1 hypothetical protein [Nonomuraea roseoviolacea subsp. carminata]